MGIKLQNTWKGHGAAWYLKKARTTVMKDGSIEITSSRLPRDFIIRYSPGNGRGKTQWVIFDSMYDVINLRISDRTAKQLEALEKKKVSIYQRSTYRRGRK